MKCIALCRVQTNHDKSQRRRKDHMSDPENKKPKRDSTKTSTIRRKTESDDDKLTPEEEKKLKEKYREIKKRV